MKWSEIRQAYPNTWLVDDLPLVHFAAFQQFAPRTDVGIDLAREYEAAVQMRA